MYERFAALAEQKGVTPYRVSKETGISQATLSDWKRGRCVPKADKLRQLADYFGVPMEDLLEPDPQVSHYKIDLDDKAPGDPVWLDEQTLALLESLRTRPEMQMLFSLTAKATKADVLKAVRIIEALQQQEQEDAL